MRPQWCKNANETRHDLPCKPRSLLIDFIFTFGLVILLHVMLMHFQSRSWFRSIRQCQCLSLIAFTLTCRRVVKAEVFGQIFAVIRREIRKMSCDCFNPLFFAIILRNYVTWQTLHKWRIYTLRRRNRGARKWPNWRNLATIVYWIVIHGSEANPVGSTFVFWAKSKLVIWWSFGMSFPREYSRYCLFCSLWPLRCNCNVDQLQKLKYISSNFFKHSNMDQLFLRRVF